MGKISESVKKETSYIAAWVVVLSAVMEGVIIILGAFNIVKWNYTIAIGNLLGGAVSVLNFFLMALTVQNAVEKDADKAKLSIHFSHILRNLMVGAVVVIGVFVPIFNVWTTALPFFFPRIGLAFRSSFNKKQENNK